MIGRISRGTKMDQVYIPKTRQGLNPGDYVVITPLDKRINQKIKEKPYFYNVKNIEPIKMIIIDNIFSIIEKKIKDYENIIITGSFLETGSDFKDVDILIIEKGKIDKNEIEKELEKYLGIKSDVIPLDNKTLISGLNSDPLYQMMLSKCISKKRFLYKIKNKINYKLLDLHLLKSKNLLDGFSLMKGREKYYSIRNLISIKLFLEKNKLSNEIVDKEIENAFKISIIDIKENMIDYPKFIKTYKKLYNILFKKIMDGIKNKTKASLSSISSHCFILFSNSFIFFFSAIS